jgi:hypothetical protein
MSVALVLPLEPRDTCGAALGQEVAAGASETRGGPGAALTFILS